MTAELLNEGAEDSVTVAIAHLLPLDPVNKAVSDMRRAGDVLPFRLVTHLQTTESIEESYADCLVSIHTMCDKNLGGKDMGYVAARDEEDRTHRRMLLLGRFNIDVPLAGGRFATVESVTPVARSGWMPYGDDQIIQKIGRYSIGLSYVPVP